MSEQSAATRFLAQLRRQMEQIADRRARRKSGVTPGGPYGTVYVDDAGHVYQASAGAGINSAVQMWGAETTVFSSNPFTYPFSVDGSEVVYDTDSHWGGALEPERFYARADGKYLITCMAQIVPTAGVYDINLQIRHTNTPLYTDTVAFWANRYCDASLGQYLGACVSGELQLRATDYITIAADTTHVSGSTGSRQMDVRLFTMRRVA